MAATLESLKGRHFTRVADWSRDELLAALDAVRERDGHALVALMVTDILRKGTALYASGDRAAIQRAFDNGDGGVIDLPGVMSRKKQVAPRLLAALAGR